MRHAIRTGLALMVVVAGSLASTAQAQTESPAEQVVLRVGTTADLITANPFGVSAGSDWSVVTIQYDLMLKFDSQDLAPAPSLAETCEPNTDFTIWTCTLREGLMWSDGTPLTSKDIAFSYRFVIDNRIPQYRSYFPGDPVFETPNDTTLIWKANEPTFAPDMPPWVYIVPEHVWAQYDGEELKTIKNVPNTPTIGSGPFVLTDWRNGESWTMERNEFFWGDEPAIDRVEFRLYTNQEAMLQALKNNEIDLADGLQPSLLTTLESLENITPHPVVSDWWLNLAFNFGGQGKDADPIPALHDIDVRKAIAMAINKEELAQKVYFGTATPGDTIVRPASAYWHLDIPAEEEFPYDPEASRQLLDDGGYVDTDDNGIREDPATGEPLELRMPASSDTTGAVDAGRLIDAYLEEIGIGVSLKPVTDSKMNDYWGTGDFDAYIWYWSGDPDPNYQLSVFTSDQCGGWSDGCWQDPTYDALYEEQQSIMNRDERLAVVQEAQRYVYEQVPVVVLAYPGWLQAYRSDRFEGWTPAPGENGYLLPGYNYESLLTLRPVTGSAATPDAPGAPAWVWGVAGAVILLAGVVLFARGRRRMDAEA